jgi:ABC-type proline/glycine betaine transport system substrate-binding protein
MRPSGPHVRPLVAQPRWLADDCEREAAQKWIAANQAKVNKWLGK